MSNDEVQDASAKAEGESGTDQDVQALLQQAEPGVKDLMDVYERIEAAYFTVATQPEPLTIYASNTGY